MAINFRALAPSHLITSDTITPAINRIVPVWLDHLAEEIIESAKAYAPRFGAANRKFGYIRMYSAGGAASEHRAIIYCTGPFVETTAFDYEFKVPIGGYRFGDIDPLTKEPFPGAMNSRGGYIILENKPEYEGEKEKKIARSYSKRSGEIVKRAGFMSQSIRKNIGEGILLSMVGKTNLQALAAMVGTEIAVNIGAQVKAECAAAGLMCTVIGPVMVTMES